MIFKTKLKNISKVNKEVLEKLIEMNNAGIIPYHIAIK